MQLHQISPTKKQKSKRRVGRGGKRGTYSGRGVKGQKSRAGRKMRPEWRDVLKRIPKRRGYKFKSIQEKPCILNLGDLNSAFKENELITAGVLLNKGLINKIKGRMPEVKILGDGELNKKLDFKGLKMSASAKSKIERAGGKVN
ncbi:50S ribosomal protein L15 [Patescibacteria group bacterium]|nr:50S ribosomal protein L15 [Patescibacteria group bacterium]